MTVSKCALLISFTCGVSAARSQNLITEDFRLSVDSFITSKNSTLILTKAQLLHAKRVYPNFSWATIKSVDFYFGTDVVAIVKCDGDSLCSNLLPLLARCGKGSQILIEAQVVNRKGQPVSWSPLGIFIRDD